MKSICLHILISIHPSPPCNMQGEVSRSKLTQRCAAYRKPQQFGDDGEEATPVPIPNTEVKLFSADGNWGLSPCESRTSPSECEEKGEFPADCDLFRTRGTANSAEGMLRTRRPWRNTCTPTSCWRESRTSPSN